MFPAVPLESQFGVLMTAASLLALAAGRRLFLPHASPRGVLKEFLRTDWRYLGVAWTVTMGVNQLAKFHIDQPFTDAIYRIEGETVAMFQSVASLPLTVYFAVVYLVGFPFLVLFTYFKLKDEAEEQAYRYAVAYLVLVVLATPFFLLFPVPVTSATVPSVEPLLYDLHPVIFAGTLATDTLMKAFPSLHTGLSLLAVLYARKSDDPLYRRTTVVLAASIVVSTLYLGIHWITDAAFAAVLVAVAYRFSQWTPIPKWGGAQNALRRAKS